MNKSSLLVKITYILVSTSHAKYWPLKYWWSALSSKVCKKIQVRPWWRSYVCLFVCFFVYLHSVPRADIVHVLHMQNADFRLRADTLEAHVLLVHETVFPHFAFHRRSLDQAVVFWRNVKVIFCVVWDVCQNLEELWIVYNDWFMVIRGLSFSANFFTVSFFVVVHAYCIASITQNDLSSAQTSGHTNSCGSI